MKKVEKQLRSGRHSAGQLDWVDSMPDTEGSRVARDFFLRVLAGLCEQSYRHWLWEEDYYPLTYPERHWYSHVAAAVEKIEAYHLSEHAIQRKSRSQDPIGGRVDLWANYRETNFLIELKRVSFGFKSKEWPGKLQSATADAFRQAKSLQREVTGDWAGGGVLAGLCLALPYAGSKNREKLNEDPSNEHAAAFMKRAIGAMSNSRGVRPNLVSVWKPPIKARMFETDSGSWEHIPFIGFLGRVDFSLVKPKPSKSVR